MKARNLIIVFLFVALLFVGCSKEKKKQEVAQGEVPATPKSGDFPKEIPIYPYQQQFKSQSAQRAARATFLTTSDVDAVLNFYEEKLPAKKWMRIGKVDKEGKTMITYKKEHKILHVTVEANTETQFTNVTLLLNR